MDKHFRTFIVVLGVAAISLIALLNLTSGSIADAGPFKQSANVLQESTASNGSTTESLPNSVPTLSLPKIAAVGVLNATQDEPMHRGWIAMQGAVAPFTISNQAREQMTVDVSSADLGDVKSGDRVGFQLPDGSEAVAHVENTWTESNGDKLWSGHVEDVAGPDYRIVVTQGAGATFASINTSKGSYSLESINGRGVVYKNPEMGDVAPRGTKDYLMPET